MITIHDISFHFGSRTLYEDTSLHIKPKDKIGLIGANGTGKSTLLRLITGEYQPDKGSIRKSNECTIGFLNQDLLSYQDEDSILSVVMQAFIRQNILQKEIDKTLHDLEHHYEEKLIEKLTKLQEEFAALDGYSIQAQAEAVLEGLGFQTEDLHRPIKQFSGGWRMRVMLGKLLLQKPSLLMLDEPTNHLDLPSIEWLENYLKEYEGAIIIVSHDRQFLDNVITSTVEVAGQKLNSYAGNYSFYLEEKALRTEIQKSAYENQQQKIRETERFIERFKAKASKAKQAQSRIKALEKMELIENVDPELAQVHFRFRYKQQPGRFILSLEHVSKSFGDLHILKNTSVQIERGDKIALIGANGKGKSTLLRIMAGIEPCEGERKLGHNVIDSLFAQHQLEALHVENTILEELKQTGSDKTETELRTILGCFLFSNDDVFKKIKILSGGEKSRVALAKTLISNANFLLLDEPTNHLDISSINILIQALQQYEGTFVTISHDRHFIAQVATKIWYIENQEIKQYPGTFEEYDYWKSQQKDSSSTSKTKKESKKQPVQETLHVKNEEKELTQKKIKKNKDQLVKIEQKISTAEKQKTILEQEMASPAIHSNPKEYEKINLQYQQLCATLIQLQTEWDQLATELEELEKKI